MKGKDVFRGLQYLEEDYIREAEFGPFSAEAFEREDPEEAPKRKLPRVLLLAAVIALVGALVGCGIVYVLNMQSLRLGREQTREEYWDESQGTFVYETVSRQVLTLSGLRGTPNFGAAKEWFDFLQTYDPEWRLYHENKEAETPWVAPAEYSLYNIYTPQMKAELDRITGKYGLKLKGAPVDAFNGEALLDYLGLEGVLRPGAKATAQSFNSAYYDGGWFLMDMDLELEGDPDWPYRFLCSLYYCSKDCFNNQVCELDETDDWQEWNYTTASGDELLVLRSPSVWFSWVFCDREDATVSLRIETIREGYGDDGLTRLPMSDETLKRVLDTIDFSVVPQPGDPALLAGPEGSDQMSQTQDGYTVTVKQVLTDGHEAQILLGITAPEDVDLERCLDSESGERLRLGDMLLTPVSQTDSRQGSSSHGTQADGDGRANTLDYHIQVSRRSEGVGLPQGSVWDLFLEDLRIVRWNRELLQEDTLWQLEGSWNFRLSMDQGQWQELEFITEPVKTRGVTGWYENGDDYYEDVTITSLILRGFGGSITWLEHRGAELCDYREEKYFQLVLKDGTVIRLMDDLSAVDPEYIGRLLPLEEADYLLLPDGTRLQPRNGT